MTAYIMTGTTTVFSSSTPGYANDDTVVGANGGDTIFNDYAGAETVYTTSGNNTVILDAFTNDSSGANWYGGMGNDSVDATTATTGVYKLYGGTGTDTIKGGGSFDILSVQGSGSTIYGSTVTGATNDYYDAFQGGDIFHGGTNAFNDFNLTGGGETAYGGNHGDTYNLTEFGFDTIHGGNGNDVIHDGTTYGGNNIYLGNGTDTVWADGANNDFIVGGSGNDTFFVGSSSQSSNVQVTGGSGNSIINAGDSQGVNYLTPSTGSGTNIVEGGNYSNHIYGNNTNGSLYMRGGSTVGGDEMVGGHGTSVFIYGGAGDFATSGSGAGVFEFNSTADGDQHIYDFNSAKDSIGISVAGFNSGLYANETLTNGYNLINGAGPVADTATFVYNNNALYFYANGTGGAAPTLVAGLVSGPATLSANNFHISAGPF